MKVTNPEGIMKIEEGLPKSTRTSALNHNPNLPSYCLENPLLVFTREYA